MKKLSGFSALSSSLWSHEHSPLRLARRLLLTLVALCAVAPAMAAGELSFTAVNNGTTVKFTRPTSKTQFVPNSLQFSKDGKNWTNYTWSMKKESSFLGIGGTWYTYTPNSTITLNAGETVYFRAGSTANTKFCYGNDAFGTSEHTGLFSSGDKGLSRSVNDNCTYYHFEFSDAVYASGNIMSMLNQDFASMTEVPAYAFEGMFADCSQLRSIPELPATKLGEKAYSCMFMNCSGLTYVSMPAKIKLGDGSCGTECMLRMFHGCYNLSTIEVGFESWGKSQKKNYTKEWAMSVTTVGSFVCPSSLTEDHCTKSNPTCSYYGGGLYHSNCFVPDGWNVLRADKDYLFFTWNAERMNNLSYFVNSLLNRAGTSTATIKLVKNTNFTDNNLHLQYSYTGNGGWTTYDAAAGVSINNKEHPGVYFRRDPNFAGDNTTLSLSASNYYTFTITLNNLGSETDGVIDVSGNIMSLLDPECLSVEVPDHAFCGLFKNNTAIYSAPELPAILLGQGCYESMFEGCTSLNSAPELPATSLNLDCYKRMFYNCSNMNFMYVAFPKWEVYDEDNTLIDNTPTQSWTYNVATTGTFICPGDLDLKYNNVEGNYNYIPWNPNRNSSNKLVQVGEDNDYLCFSVTSTSGTIRLDRTSADLDNLTGKLQYTFTPWNENSWQNYTWAGTTGMSISLNRKTNQYRVYFRNSTTDDSGLVSTSAAQYIFAVTGNIEATGNVMSLLSKGCDRIDVPANAFRGLFKNCATLLTAPEMPATLLSDNCYHSMFQGTGIEDAPELPATTMRSYCYAYMFQNCSKLISAPQLPAKSLASYCYVAMFKNCTSLTSAPELPATQLVTGCYKQMFYGSKNLNYIKVGFTGWNISTNYEFTTDWCGTWGDTPSNGAFLAPADLVQKFGASYIPKGWTPIQDGGANDYICFSAQISGAKVGLYKYGNPNSINLIYSTDDCQHWSTYHVGTDITLYTAGKTQRVYFRAGKVTADGVDDTGVTGVDHTAFSKGTKDYYYFKSNLPSSLAVTGNVMSLLHSNCLASNSVPEFAFHKLFWGMSAITTAPKVPAANLSRWCYASMFEFCQNLTVAPELPAATMVDNCYGSMFYRCYKLTTAPELPAKTLDYKCYYRMFWDCINLTTAPELPATTLASSCYEEMFMGCRSLNFMKVSFTSWGSKNIAYTKNWAADCSDATHTDHEFSKAGTFMSPSGLKYIEGASNVPYNWVQNPHTVNFTAVTKSTIRLNRVSDSALPVNIRYSTNSCRTWDTLTWADGNPAQGALIELKKGAIAYFQALPEQPNTSLNGYQFVISGTLQAAGNIMSLLDSDQDLTEIPSNYCFSGLFKDCSTLTSAPELPATTLTEGCYKSLFSGCAALVEAPALPALECKKSCYAYMFYGCKSIFKAPYLPATTLAEKCYDHLFAQCTNLNYLRVGFEGWFSDYETEQIASAKGSNASAIAGQSWLQNVSPSGTFIGPSSLKKDEAHRNYSGWTKSGTKLTYDTKGEINNGYEFKQANDWGQFIPYYWTIPTTLGFTSEQNGSTVALNLKGSMPNVAGFMYSSDNENWKPYTAGTSLIVNRGQTIYFQYNPGSQSDVTDQNWVIGAPLYVDENNRYYFSITGKVAATGNIGSLIKMNYNGDWYDKENMFRGVFEGCEGLITAPDVPTINCTKNVFRDLFKGCKNMTTAPSLPSTSLSESCYQGMFEGCESLTSSPELPAGNLIKACYKNMYKGCKSLVNVPTLIRANLNHTISESCFEGMFEDCTSLEECPLIPHDNYYDRVGTAVSCFKNMFKGCTSLVGLLELQTNELSPYCFEGMFEGCTAMTRGPILAQTNLAKGCYKRMFAGSGLTSAPSLPATTLVDSCYAEMFQGASNLRFIETDLTSWQSFKGVLATVNWVDGVSKNGTFLSPRDLVRNPIFDASHIPFNDTYPWNVDTNGDFLCFTPSTGYDNNGNEVNWEIFYLKLIRTNGKNHGITAKYSFDKETWITFDANQQIAINNPDGAKHVYVRISDGRLGNNENDLYRFQMSGTANGMTVKLSGNMMSLLDASLESAEVPDYAFYRLFQDCNMINDITELKLPAAEVGAHAYSYMFKNCSLLQSTEDEVPALPATKVGYAAYEGLFEYFTELVNAPALPATSLSKRCYSEMFQGCTKLAAAPELPAETLQDSCYRYMFSGCKAMKYLKVGFTSWDKKGATDHWTQDVAKDGEFVGSWTVIQDAITRSTNSSGVVNYDLVFSRNRIPKEKSFPWVLLLETKMKMNYAEGYVLISGGTNIYYSRDHEFTKDNYTTDPEVKFSARNNTKIYLTEWLNEKVDRLDSTIIYGMVTSPEMIQGKIATPIRNQVTVYRYPRVAGYCLAESSAQLEECLYYANNVSSATYPIKIFIPDGEYEVDHTLEVKDNISVIGETIEGTHIKTTDENGVFDITGKNVYIQDMTLENETANADGQKIAFIDRGNSTTTMNFSIATGNKYMDLGGGDEGVKNAPYWDRENDQTQQVVDSVSINGNTISIVSEDPYAYLIRVVGAGYALISKPDAYVLRDMTPENVIIRASNNRGGFGDGCKKFTFASPDGEVYNGLGKDIVLNKQGYTSFSYTDATEDYIRVYGASAYTAKYNEITHKITLSKLNEYDFIPKEVGVILFGTPKKAVTFFKLSAEEKKLLEEMPAYDTRDNDLIGNYSSDTLRYRFYRKSLYFTAANNKNYIDITSQYNVGESDMNGRLYGLSGEVFKYLNDKAKIAPNKAYLDLPYTKALANAAAVRTGEYVWEFEVVEDATGIEDLSADENADSLYDLQGRRTDVKRGIVVKDGKAVMQK